MTTSPPRTLQWVILLTSILVAMLVGLAAYQWVAAASLQHRVIAQRRVLAREQQRSASLHNMATLEVSLAERMARHAAPWTWNEQLPPMMAQVSQLIKHSGAKLDTMQSAPVVEQGVVRFPLRLTLRADLRQLVDLLQRLRTTEPVLGVDQMSIRTPEQGGAMLHVDMTLSAYVLVEGRLPGGARP
jgi:Tfp pilus assembly protein PilO